jgi:hypothetical protein
LVSQFDDASQLQDAHMREQDQTDNSQSILGCMVKKAPQIHKHALAITVTEQQNNKARCAGEIFTMFFVLSRICDQFFLHVLSPLALALLLCDVDGLSVVFLLLIFFFCFFSLVRREIVLQASSPSVLDHWFRCIAQFQEPGQVVVSFPKNFTITPFSRHDFCAALSLVSPLSTVQHTFNSNTHKILEEQPRTHAIYIFFLSFDSANLCCCENNFADVLFFSFPRNRRVQIVSPHTAKLTRKA